MDTTSRMSTTDIAKEIRKDLKAAFPGVKFGVKTSRFAGGSSIDVKIKSASFRICNHERIEHDLFQPHVFSELPRHTEGARAFERDVERVASRLHWDKSDLQTDYFHCNFYLHVSFDSDLVQRDRSVVEFIVREQRGAA